MQPTCRSCKFYLHPTDFIYYSNNQKCKKRIEVNAREIKRLIKEEKLEGVTKDDLEEEIEYLIESTELEDFGICRARQCYFYNPKYFLTPSQKYKETKEETIQKMLVEYR